MSSQFLFAGSPAPPTVAFSLNNSGLSSLTYNGTEFHYGNQFQWVQVWLTDSQGNVTTVNGGPLTTVLDSVNNTFTETFTWGSVSIAYSAAANKLLANTTVTNSTPDKTIQKLRMYSFGVQFPQTPSSISNFQGGVPYENNVDAPSVILANWPTGTVALVNDDATTPLGIGFAQATSPPGPAWYIDTYVSSQQNYPNPGWAPTPRPIAPGASDTYTLSLRFGPAGATAQDLAADIFQKFAQAFPYQLNWPDRRPIAEDFLAGSGQQNSPTNPRSYSLWQCPTDIYTSTGLARFQSCLMTRADDNIARMLSMNAQGIITWDMEGIEFPGTVYVGSPDKLPLLSPELDAIADAYFAKYRAAGFRVGMTIRPQILTFTSSPRSATQLDAGGPGPSIQAVIDKITYARNRWGATIFYLDSDLEWGQNYPYVSTIFDRIHQLYPDVLLIPEWHSPQYYAVSAGYDGFGTNPYAIYPTAQWVYPQAFGVIANIPGNPTANQFQDVETRIQEGNIPLMTAWYNSPTNATVQAIYTALGTVFPIFDTTPPTVPAGLSATAASAGTAALSWNASSDNVGVMGYKIYRNGTLIGTTASLSYTDVGLMAATTYTYAVGAYDAAGNESTHPNAVNVTTLDLSLPPSPAINWVPPTLNWPAVIPLNGTLSISYGSLPVAQVEWDFVAGPNITTSPSFRTPAAASRTASYTTTSGVMSPVKQGVTLGTYQVSVKLLDANGVVQTTAGPQAVTFVSSDLSGIKVYPNPWRSDKHAAIGMTFDGLTVGTDIKIFTVAGHEVKKLHTDGPKIVWDLTNDSGDKVSSGVYLYLITDSQGDRVRGKLAVIK